MSKPSNSLSELLKVSLRSAVFLAMFAVIGTALVAGIYWLTYEQIVENERQTLLRNLENILPPSFAYDNDLLADTLEIPAIPELGLRKPEQIYRARLQGHPVAALIPITTYKGYNGPIRMLMAIQSDNSLIGVRVLSHTETPGLGDLIEERKSSWIYSFSSTSLRSPEENQWKVKKDGGAFDEFTGATITPRAIVEAVYQALKYFEQHREMLFNDTSDPKPALDPIAEGRQ